MLNQKNYQPVLSAMAWCAGGAEQTHLDKPARRLGLNDEGVTDINASVNRKGIEDRYNPSHPESSTFFGSTLSDSIPRSKSTLWDTRPGMIKLGPFSATSW